MVQSNCYQTYLNITIIEREVTKRRVIFPMVISFEFRMGQYTDKEHRESVLHFTRDHLDLLEYFDFLTIVRS